MVSRRGQGRGFGRQHRRAAGAVEGRREDPARDRPSGHGRDRPVQARRRRHAGPRRQRAVRRAQPRRVRRHGRRLRPHRARPDRADHRPAERRQRGAEGRRHACATPPRSCARSYLGAAVPRLRRGPRHRRRHGRRRRHRRLHRQCRAEDRGGRAQADGRVPAAGVHQQPGGQDRLSAGAARAGPAARMARSAPLQRCCHGRAERRRGEVARRHRRAGFCPCRRCRDGHGGAPVQRPDPRRPRAAQASARTKPTPGDRRCTARTRRRRQPAAVPRSTSSAVPATLHLPGSGRVPTTINSPPPDQDLHAARSILAGCGGYLPERIVTNDELSRTVDTSDEWIRERTGIRQRHFAARHETCAFMGAAAARAALADAGADRRRRRRASSWPPARRTRRSPPPRCACRPNWG